MVEQVNFAEVFLSDVCTFPVEYCTGLIIFADLYDRHSELEPVQWCTKVSIRPKKSR